MVTEVDTMNCSSSSASSEDGVRKVAGGVTSLGSQMKRPELAQTRCKKQALVYPWNLVPDRWIAGLTWALLLPFLPLFVTVISLGMMTQGVLFVFNRLFMGMPAQAFLKCSEASAEFGKRFMRDPRDCAKVIPIFFLMVWSPAIFAYAAYRSYTYGFEWWFVPLYHLMRIGPRFRFFAYLYVLIHQEGHCYEGFFKAPLTFLNGSCQWFTALFFGQVPNVFRVGHNKCHHRHDNMLDDVCTNLDLDRSKPWSFVIYFPRFAAYWTGFGMIPYFGSRKEWKLMAEMMMGMFVIYTLWALSYYTMGVLFTTFYVVFPHFEGIIFFGGISYLWHAFCEPDDPYNTYVNSMTVLEGHDNIFNEDYHVEHHNCAHLHPSDYKGHYDDNVEKFRTNQATIFRDCEEGTLLYFLLSEKWDELAKHFVDLNGKMTDEEKKVLLLRRLRSRFNRPADDEVQYQKEQREAQQLKAKAT